MPRRRDAPRLAGQGIRTLSSRVPPVVSVADGSQPEVPGLPAGEALSHALLDAVRLLFRPFDGWRWMKLTVVCLFLGGGTPAAAFHWSFSSLPGDIRLSEVVIRAVQYIMQSPWLILVTVTLGMAVVLAWLYLRSVFRFVLVDSIFRRDVSLGPAWTALRPLGQSYFFWLVGMLAALGLTFAGIAAAAYPYLQSAAAAGSRSLGPSLLLAAILASIVLVGLGVALLVMLTDDLVVPLMYAGRTSLARAWREVWRTMRAEPASFAVYLLLRLAVAVGIGIAVLLFLFPVLLSVFSGALIAAALLVLLLHALGLAWVWSTSTIFLAVAALLLLSGLILILLSVVGMPGQVLLQDFGIYFMASRFPPLESMWRIPSEAPRDRGEAEPSP